MTATENSGRNLVKTKMTIDGYQFKDMTLKEFVIGESLTTPGLQVALTIQSHIYATGRNTYEDMKNKDITIEMQTDSGKRMMVKQKIYRLDMREYIPVNIGQVEEFTLHACDPSLLEDAKKLVSNLWKCTRPSAVVEEVLQSCLGLSGDDVDIQKCEPARDYLAERIHPFQVIAQQANVSLDDDDPSFLHYMTFNEQTGKGIHHFRSLKNLCNQAVPLDFSGRNTFVHYEGTGAAPYNLNDEHFAFGFSFPCDFDLLSDILNGVDEQGKDINLLATFNPLISASSLVGGKQGACQEGANFKMAMTNKGSSSQQNGCDSDVEKYLLKRQARMSLLDRDKIALRIICPWRPDLHVGNIITLNLMSKDGCTILYGTGDYLIASLKHHIDFGGTATTTLDCVSKTAGGGKV